MYIALSMIGCAFSVTIVGGLGYLMSKSLAPDAHLKEAPVIRGRSIDIIPEAFHLKEAT